jgi:hypothetical protein
MSVSVAIVILSVTAVVAGGLSLLARRRLPRLADLDSTPWTSVLGYVATAYGVILGFTIVFLFGEFAAARNAIGNEATSIGTAFDEARLFPESQVDIQHALICYGRAVSAFDWPALRDGASSPVVDDAYRDIFVTLGEVSESTDGTFQPATATNLVVQVGNIATARAVRIVAAEVRVPPMLWGLLVFGGVLVVGFLFVVTTRAGPRVQAVLIALSAVFTVVMFVMVVALSAPFSDAAGRLSPRVIEQTTASMESNARAATTMPCRFDTPG